jgi:hypothetical protein
MRRTVTRRYLHGAMAVYLARYPNVPPALLPGESSERLDDLPAEAEEIRAALLDTFDHQQQIGAAARLVARHLMLGHSPDTLNSYKGSGLAKLTLLSVASAAGLAVSC